MAWLFAGVSALVGLAHLLLRAKGIFLYSYDLGGIETNVVYVFHKAVLGLPMYSDPERLNFDIVQYPPLYFVVLKGLALLFGSPPEDPYWFFVLNRSFALVCNLLTVLLVARMAMRAGVPKWWAWFWALVAFGTLPVQLHGRTDSLYLLLFTGAMSASLKAISMTTRREAIRYWSIASVLAGLSVLSKQTGMLTIGIIGLHHLLSRNIRLAFLHGTVSLVVVALGLGWAAWEFGAEVMYKNIVIGVRNGYSLAMLKEVFLKHDYVQLMGIHAASAWLVLRWWRSPAPDLRFLAIAMACSFAFAVVTGIKSGSKINYFMEHFMLTYVALPIGLLGAGAALWRALLAAYGLQYLILCLAVEQAQLKRADPGGAGRERYAEDRELVRYLREDLGMTPDDRAFILGRGFVELMLSGSSVMNQKDVLHFSPPGLYDHHEFHQAIRDGRIRFFISRKPVERFHYLGVEHGPFTVKGRSGGYWVLTQAANGR